MKTTLVATLMLIALPCLGMDLGALFDKPNTKVREAHISKPASDTVFTQEVDTASQGRPSHCLYGLFDNDNIDVPFIALVNGRNTKKENTPSVWEQGAKERDLRRSKERK